MKYDKLIYMTITFKPLAKSHFTLLLKWLEMPHIKLWWDKDTKWTPELIKKKYESYVKGYKVVGDNRKEIKAYIIQVDKVQLNSENFRQDEFKEEPAQRTKVREHRRMPKNSLVSSFLNDAVPIGYIQLYNAYDFPRTKPLIGLPSSLAAFDIFIGEENYLNQGIGSQALKIFLKNSCDKKYTHIFAAPDSKNIKAIKTYEKAGFKIVQEYKDIGEIWMLKTI